MAVAILRIHIRIVVDKVFVASVVRRIYVDNIYLAGMGICQCGERFKVVTFDKHMVRRILSIADDGTLLHLGQHRQFIFQPCLYLLWLILPYKSIFLLGTQQSKQRRLLLIAEPLCGTYFVS